MSRGDPAHRVRNEIGHDPATLRTDAEQRLVHRIVEDRVRRAISQDENVVLEFLVYERPPLRLLDYRDFVEREGAEVVIRVLRPRIESILERRAGRGRADDHSSEAARAVAHQLACLDDETVDRSWVIDPSDEEAEDTYQRHFASLVEKAR